MHVAGSKPSAICCEEVEGASGPLGPGQAECRRLLCISFCMRMGRTLLLCWWKAGAVVHLLTASLSTGLSVPNVHGALAPLAIPSAAAAAAAAGRIAIPGLAGAGNSVLLVSNLNPEVRGSSRLLLDSLAGELCSWVLVQTASRPRSCNPLELIHRPVLMQPHSVLAVSSPPFPRGWDLP